MNLAQLSEDMHILGVDLIWMGIIRQLSFCSSLIFMQPTFLVFIFFLHGSKSAHIVNLCYYGKFFF